MRVSATGVCQTDVHFRPADIEMTSPETLHGHEIAGTVAEINGPSGSISTGQQVVVHPVCSCGGCRMCVAGRENTCLNTAGRG